MSGLWIGARGTRFVDAHGRQAILRGLNLGADGKLPYPGGGTDQPSDFSDHETVSFVGRPFPLEEADQHFTRIAGWGFNTLRLIVTWEAVEHAGPGRHDQDYIEYIGRICERAREFGLIVFVDFHQDVWSRMSGGSGAPGWIFAKLGLDFRSFGTAGAAHVMQYRYDYSNPQKRQEDRYPSMSWAVNYRMPVNGIVWTAFFAGATLTPDWRVDGVNVQDYLQAHYLGAMRALAQRLRDLPNVIGFDTLNEPGLGWIGQKLSQRDKNDNSPLRAGPSWTPLDGLKVARGVATTLPYHVVNAERTTIESTREIVVNEAGVRIWVEDGADPFERAGAWRLDNGQATTADEDFFRARAGKAFNAEQDFLQPFFHKVAQAIRSVRPDWLLFAEVSPYAVMQGRGFPKDMPAGSVNASHWYDVSLLWSKRFDENLSEQRRAELRRLYQLQLAFIRSFGDRMNGGAPSLVGEFGVPYDLNDGRSFARWAAGERGPEVWKAQANALELMYEAMDALLLSSTQWNYTASNRNDLRVGDGWNQEDLSVFSQDQRDAPGDTGGRAIEGFCRPYVQRAQGTILEMRYTPETRTCFIRIDADHGIAAPTEIYVPAAFSSGVDIHVSGEADWSFAEGSKRLLIRARVSGELRIELRRKV
jgi:hypothetical protein